MKVMNISGYNSNTYRIFHIHRNLIQKSRKNNLEIILKSIVRQGRGYYFLSITWHLELRIWRVDVYDPTTSKSYMTYFQKDYFVEHSEMRRKWREYLRIGKMYIQVAEKLLIIDSEIYQLFETFGTLYNFEKESMNKGTI